MGLGWLHSVNWHWINWGGYVVGSSVVGDAVIDYGVDANFFLVLKMALFSGF